jgi:hypothetical protein
MISASPTANGKFWKAKVTQENGKNVAECEITNMENGESYQEVWVWDDHALAQTEIYTAKHSKATKKNYTATNVNGKYIMNSKNQEPGNSGSGQKISPYVTITASEDGFTYEAWRVTEGALVKYRCLIFSLKK